MENPTEKLSPTEDRSSALAVASGSALFTELRRIPIDFHEVALSAGVLRGKLCHSPHFGWGVRTVDGKPADFCPITPPPLHEGETELRISADELHWIFMGFLPNVQRSETPARRRSL